jgi:hypothetical protein
VSIFRPYTTLAAKLADDDLRFHDVFLGRATATNWNPNIVFQSFAIAAFTECRTLNQPPWYRGGRTNSSGTGVATISSQSSPAS